MGCGGSKTEEIQETLSKKSKKKRKPYLTGGLIKIFEEDLLLFLNLPKKT